MNRAIEVKRRSGSGAVEVSDNEWAAACNLRDRYWLHAAFDCGTPRPRLVKVRDPFGRLPTRAKGYAVRLRYASADPGAKPLDCGETVGQVDALLEEVRRRLAEAAMSPPKR